MISQAIDLSETDYRTLISILEEYVPECKVRVFGSRLHWTSKSTSDVDIVIVGDKKVSREALMLLREALENSPLSVTVDVLDWHCISENFREEINKEFSVIKRKTEHTVRSKLRTWKYYKVEDFAEIVSGGTPDTKVKDYWNGNIKWITPKDMSNTSSRFIENGSRNITEEGLK